MQNELTVESALDFLRNHQPMPNTDKVDCEDLLREYDNVINFFISHPDIRAVPLFFGSFGGGDGHGVYQYVHEVIKAFPVDVIAPHIIMALHSESEDIRAYAGEFSFHLKPYAPLIRPLFERLTDPNPDIRTCAVYGLSFQHSKFLKESLIELCENEKEQDVKAAYAELFELMNDPEQPCYYGTVLVQEVSSDQKPSVSAPIFIKNSE